MISSPGWAGRQCSANASGLALASSSSVITYGRERLAARGGLVVGVAHAHPHVRVDGVRAVDRLRGSSVRIAPVSPAELVAVRRRDAHLDPGQRPHDGERAGDVVAVADVGHHAAFERAEASRRVCRSASAWHGWCSGDSMFTTGTVACSASVLISSSSPVRRPITRRVARQDVGGVAHGLAARELHLLGAQHHRMPAELEDAGLERGARARRRLLEQQRDRAALERARRERRLLERGGAVQQQIEPVRVQLGSGDEVCGCWH